MGYRVPKRTALITFEGTDYDGAELECRLDVSLDMLFSFQEMAGDSSQVQREAILRFGDEILISWNVEDDRGNPMPADGAGFLSQPAAFVTAVMKAWTETATAVPGPLGQQSNDGDGLAGPSARMVG